MHAASCMLPTHVLLPLHWTSLLGQLLRLDQNVHTYTHLWAAWHNTRLLIK